MELKVIARIKSDFPTKFGIPRQSGLTGLFSYIVFEKDYRREEALRGLDGFEYIWIIWGFDRAERDSWSPTVRPPRLGGNKRVGVFATRSPYRPNPLALSSVKIERIVKTEESGTVIVVSGADIADNTPVYDIKPYLPFTDSHEHAKAGFADETVQYKIEVVFRCDLPEEFSEEKKRGLRELLESDPRPAYQEDEDRRYGFLFSGYEIGFFVKENVLTVTEIIKADKIQFKGRRRPVRGDR